MNNISDTIASQGGIITTNGMISHRILTEYSIEGRAKKIQDFIGIMTTK